MIHYFQTLGEEGGQAWNRFWFSARDAHTLCLVRFFTGVVSIYWYLTYFADLEQWFGPRSIVPADLLRKALGSSDLRFSYLDYIHSSSTLWGAYWIGLVVLLAFTFGLFSRIAAIASYVVLISFVHRAPVVITPFEEVLPLVLLTLCIGPCGAFFSLDAWRNRKSPQPSGNVAPPPPPGYGWLANLATRLLQVHVTLLYAMLVISKLRLNAWWTGEAAWLLIARPESRLVDMTELVGSKVIAFWTHGIILFEVFFPFAVWSRLLRPLAIVVSAVAWALIALLTGMIAYSALMFVAGLIFIPGESVRDWLAGRRAIAAVTAKG